MLRQVKSIPRPRDYTSGYVGKDIRDFCRQGMACAEVTFEGKSPTSVASSCRRYVRTHGLAVTVVQRTDEDGSRHVYLVRGGGKK